MIETKSLREDLRGDVIIPTRPGRAQTLFQTVFDESAGRQHRIPLAAIGFRRFDVDLRFATAHHHRMTPADDFVTLHHGEPEATRQKVSKATPKVR